MLQRSARSVYTHKISINICHPFTSSNCSMLTTSSSLIIVFPHFVLISERRYGCYRLGILVACIICLVLMIGTIPATITIRNNKIVLIFLCVTLGIVLVLLALFFVWQQRHARQMRERYGRPYVPHIYNKVISSTTSTYTLMTVIKLFECFSSFSHRMPSTHRCRQRHRRHHGYFGVRRRITKKIQVKIRYNDRLVSNTIRRRYLHYNRCPRHHNTLR